MYKKVHLVYIPDCFQQVKPIEVAVPQTCPLVYQTLCALCARNCSAAKSVASSFSLKTSCVVLLPVTNIQSLDRTLAVHNSMILIFIQPNQKKTSKSLYVTKTNVM